MSIKDHYATLGVLAEADIAVIKAAYKVLIQRYHPDKYKGDKSVAEETTRKLNKAYNVLRDSEKRAAYDAERAVYEKESRTFEYATDNDEDVLHEQSQLEKDWDLILEYYPDIKVLEARLSKISSRLGLGFKVALIESKDFNNRYALAKKIEAQFLANYFGSNLAIIKFASELLLQGHREAAQELNRIIATLGSNVPAEVVINKIKSKYFLHAHKQGNSYIEVAEGKEGEYAFAFIMLLIFLFVLVFLISTMNVNAY